MYIRCMKKTIHYVKIQFLRTMNANIERESCQRLLMKTSFHGGLSFEK